MKFYFSLAVLGLFLGSDSAFSLKALSGGPSVEFSKAIMTQIAGVTEGAKGVLNCQTLLNKQWAYPNAQVTAFCNEAETGCLRYAMILKYMQRARSEVHAARLKGDASLAWNDTQLRLRGCALAIEASVNNSNFIYEFGQTIFY